MDSSIKDIKSVYIETGRLNRNVIEKEIAISWYKCKLQSLHPGDQIRRNFTDSKCNFEYRFKNYVDSIIDGKYQYILANKNLHVCHSRLTDDLLKQINSIDDLYLGTNAGYIANKIKSNYQVRYDEHFLDALSIYCTCGIYLSDGNTSFGTLTLFSKDEVSSYEIIKIVETLNKYYKKETFEVLPVEDESNDYELALSELFNYDFDYFQDFEYKVNRLSSQMNTFLVKGTAGSGKTTLCQYFAMKKTGIIGYFNAEDVNNLLHEQCLIRLLSQNDTVIIESIEKLNESLLGLLTVYSEGLITQKYSLNHSNYKCKTLILSTTYSDCESSEIDLETKAFTKLISKLTLCTVNLVNSREFKAQSYDFAKRIIEKRNIKASNNFIKKVAFDLEHTDYKHAIENVENSLKLSVNAASDQVRLHISDHEMSMKTLEDFELDYIQMVFRQLDENIAATAEVLGIGRSTLYRKLEKCKMYQNNTLINK
ncbi:MAG: hypothetical protein BGO41_09405 [Clostridiales bacterium 38-18]|nr:MAG: hypothetical protein BGO41_09405 [Clostridiales bacterium 38-18]